LLENAQGYLELGMLDDAWNSLEAVEADSQEHPDVLTLRLAIMMAGKKWEQAVTIGKSLCDSQPEDEEAFIQTAYCLHELRQTKEAKEILLSGPKSIQDNPLFHYNLGCYEAQLGQFEAAKTAVKKAIQIDRVYRRLAMEDPDLEPIKKSLTSSKS
jgi:predicted Zn-dependent protease